jgi:hypothetical protein
MKRRYLSTRFFAFVLVSGLCFLSCKLGNAPMAPEQTGTNNNNVPPQVVDSTSKNMTISATPSRLPAGSSQYAQIRVVVVDDNRNPVAGQPVAFFADNYGVITARDTTNDSGVAVAIYQGERINAEVPVYAKTQLGDSTIWVGTSVTLYGMQLTITPVSSNALKGAVVPVTIRLLDGTNLPVASAKLRITGATPDSGATRGDGTFSAAVTRSTEGSAIISVSSLGATATDTIMFWTTLPSGPVDTVKSIRSLTVFPSRAQIRADNSDFCEITAILVNENNNPMIGDTIEFTSDIGRIDHLRIVDSTGAAKAVLRSSPINGTCQVIASLKGHADISDTTSVVFAGVTLELSTPAIEYSVKDTATVEALLKDGSANPISGYDVTFTVVGTNATFTNGKTMITTPIDPTGKTSARVVTISAGPVRVLASALNTSASVTLQFATNNLTLSASKTSLAAGGVDSTRITATYRNNNNEAIKNALIQFATNAGRITRDTVTTDASGQASTWLKSASFAGSATVIAKSPNGSASIAITFTAAKAHSILLTISPDNIGVRGGTATLEATVTDSNGNMVSDAMVNFRILKGPGGGEYIDKPLMPTVNGVARSQILAGTIPSQYRGCEIEASVEGLTSVSKLTISGEPYVITVSRPEEDTVTVPKGGLLDETTFDFNIGAVVQDINGNPVADGTPVHFSAVVSGMSVAHLVLDHWAGLESAQEKKAVLRYAFWSVPFEDINNNLRMDANIDLKLDWNDAIARRGDDVDGNGTCDYSPAFYDFFWDFNGNGVCDPAVGEPVLIDHIDTTMSGTTVIYDTTFNWNVYADLNQNGHWDASELATDHNGNDSCDLPASGDFRFALWEMRTYWRGERFDFETNDFAVVINASVTTIKGVAYAKLTYPRQMARRLIVNVNAESNGIRDRDGERFTLPIVREQ